MSDIDTVFIDKKTGEPIHIDVAVKYAVRQIEDNYGLKLDFLEWFFDDENYSKTRLSESGYTNLYAAWYFKNKREGDT